MQSVQIAREVRKANLEAALLAMLRFGSDEGYDGLDISVTGDDGQTVIDLQFTKQGIPMAGESL